MLEQTDAITNGVLEPVMFVLALSTVLLLSSVTSVPTMLRINILFSYHRRYVILAMDSFVKQKTVQD
jgi:hypothetical protein